MSKSYFLKHARRTGETYDNGSSNVSVWEFVDDEISVMLAVKEIDTSVPLRRIEQEIRVHQL